VAEQALTPQATIREFIKTLAAKLGHVGCIDRAKYLFDMAMERGKVRWGRKAKLTAASALAIACREDKKADPLRELAVGSSSMVYHRVLISLLLCQVLVGESSTTLARAYTTTAGLVRCSSVSSDPSLHLSTLKSYVMVVLRPSDESAPALSLPPAVRKELGGLAPQLLAVERTACELCSLFGRLGTFAELSTAPTACALFMLALEAEARKPLSSSTALAGLLGARFGCAGTTVQGRYKVAYDIAESWMAEHIQEGRRTAENGSCEGGQTGGGGKEPEGRGGFPGGNLDEEDQR
jgi:transcription factor IIIB 90 kDa subunit